MNTNTDHKTILLVDDDYEFREEQRAQLEQEGFRVVEAESRREATALIPHCAFDIAIVDLMMEEADAGFVLSREIKLRKPGTPVIIVTGVARETGLEFDVATPEERKWIKADALLAKPIRFEQLIREIRRLTADRRS